MNSTQPNEGATDSEAALYKRVQTHLANRDVVGARQTALQIHDKDYRTAAFKETAQAQLQAGDLAGAAFTAQGMPYWDTRGEMLGKIIQAYLTTGDVGNAQHLAATITNSFACPNAMRAIAEAQVRAGAAAEARQTLEAAQQQVQTWGEGGPKMGYPRDYYLRDIVEAQISIGDLAAANQTAQTIALPEYREQALRAVHNA